MLFDFSNVESEEELFRKLDQIRADVMFKNREECLNIISKVYIHGVETGRFSQSAVEGLLGLYRERATYEELERITVMCLYENELNQIDEVNNAVVTSKNGILK